MGSNAKAAAMRPCALLSFNPYIRLRMPTMRLVGISCVLAILALIAGCAGVIHRNVFPPRASIQQVTVQADGNWKIELRVENFSNVSTTVATVNAKIVLAGNDAGTVAASPSLRIGPESADIVETTLKPSPAAAQAITSLHGGSVAYKLGGRIVTSDPSGDYPYTFDGRLSPVPGLPGVLR
jgi:hypothetical protein